MSRMSSKRPRWGLVLTISLVVFGAAGAGAWAAYTEFHRGPDLEALPRHVVHRTNLNTSVVASGKIESSESTLIECQLEKLRFSGNGGSLRAEGRSQILELIPDGSTVRKGDVLCRIDSSEYEEMARQQEITLQKARNDCMKAQMDLKAAEIALSEYRDGLLPDQVQSLESSIVMARSDLKRQSDRLEWSERMLKNGYISESVYATEQQRIMTAEFNLANLLGQKRVLNNYKSPTSLLKLEMAVGTARSNLAFQELRLKRTEQMMQKFLDQIELCTIRSPHAGFVIYASRDDDDDRVELGAEVHQRMDLFYLPDLGQLEVQAMLHETVISQVEPGMNVRVRVESMPQYELEGHVVSISPLPLSRRRNLMDEYVKNYVGVIQLHAAPEGVLPGMTARVEIETAQKENALVVPSQAVVHDGTRDYCYVVGKDSLEMREVEVGMSARQLLEVRSGLDEGEEIIKDVTALDEPAASL